MKILLGDISSYKAIVVGNFLKKYYPDIIIHTFDSRSFTSRIRTRFSDHHYVIKDLKSLSIKKILDENEIDFFIPVINDRLNFFWDNKKEFVPTLNYLGEFETYEILNDKSKLHALALKLGIKVPEKYLDLSSAKLPFVVKPTNLSSSKGVVYVQTKEDYQEINLTDNTIIQQFVEGKGVGYSFYCRDGVIKDSYGHLRLGEYPVSGGSSTYREHYLNPKLHEISSKIVSHLNYTGFAMFEFKLTGANELFLIEVNPRIWGSINQGLVNGVNFFQDILGPSKVDNKSKSRELKTYLGPLIYISLIQYLITFNFRPVLTFMRNVFVNKPDVNIVKDPGGYLSMIIRKFSHE